MENITKEFMEKRIKDLQIALLKVQQECVRIEQVLIAKRQVALQLEGALTECDYLMEQGGIK